ncbi:MAG: hypothetical protein JNM20_13805 [Rhizobiales bacterium]|nr:hypothetical protein [Hyphomicrobiales bacterium]
MKMLKWALLGGAAVAVTATAAQADELSDLKAQLEALQQRVTQLEAQPTTSLPSGYSLMSFRNGGAVYDAVPEKADMRELTSVDNGFTIGVMPTADVAPVAEVTVSGEIRTILVYNGQNDVKWKERLCYEDLCFEEKFKYDDSDDQLDVRVRGRLVVTGKADTAVGEVGGRIRLQAGSPFDDDNSVDMNQAYAWWKFSPSWQLIAGLWDSTSAVQAGIDWDFTGPGYTGLLGDDGSTEQMRLVFNNGGPVTFAIALEDNESDDVCAGNSTLFQTCYSFWPNFLGYDGLWVAGANRGNDLGDVPAIAGYIAYDSGGVFLQLTGLWEQDKRKYYWEYSTPFSFTSAYKNADDNWFVGAGARFGLGDVATLTAAAFWGEGYQDAVYTLIGPDDQYWGASLGIIANVGEASRLEIGGAYFKNDDAFFGFLEESWQATAGWFWDPVSQVTVFVTGSYAWNSYKGACIHSPDGGCNDADFSYKIGDFDQNTWQALFGTTLRF